jgi:hypothetical protein
MPLSEELTRVAERAGSFAGASEEVTAVIPTEPAAGLRVYLCAYGPGDRSWLALDSDARPVESRALLRDAVTIAAMCEIAEDAAGGGDLLQLRARLDELRRTENPPGLDEAEQAALDLAETIGSRPRLASPAYLDSLGVATRRLENALGTDVRSPFAEALRGTVEVVEELTREVEATYKLELK